MAVQNEDMYALDEYFNQLFELNIWSFNLFVMNTCYTKTCVISLKLGIGLQPTVVHLIIPSLCAPYLYECFKSFWQNNVLMQRYSAVSAEFHQELMAIECSCPARHIYPSTNHESINTIHQVIDLLYGVVHVALNIT